VRRRTPAQPARRDGGRRGILGAVLTLELLTPDDWPLWRQLRHRALEEAPHAFGSTLAEWQGDGDRAERWRARLEAVAHNVVARLDGEPAGMASGTAPDDHGAGELISMWVSPAARGRGVGDALVAEIVRWERAVGAATLDLDVVETNTAAIALYERHGFVLVGPVPDPDPAKPEVRMRLPLT
jgi:ribosomal protein S18 acetylase RimI-like enzyme